MEIKEVRRENLRTLVHRAAGQSALARKMGTSPAYISQILSKKSRGEVGDVFARELEKAFDLEELWMDTDHTDIRVRTVRLYDAHDIAELSSGREPPQRNREPVPVQSRLSDLGFGYVMDSDEMSPDIQAGSFLVVEPGIDPKPGMIVLLYAAQSDQVFVRKMRMNLSGEIELKASDPTVSIAKLQEDAHYIAGVVVESILRRVFISQ
jgi:transcriptional regulator with XRE-family HTH domain